MGDFFKERPAAFVAVLMAILLSIGGLAVAQQGNEEPSDTGTEGLPAEATDGTGGDGTDDPGPPWTRDGYAGTWQPGTAGPPPWAGAEEGDGGPPFLREGYDTGWRPGEGAPPWAGGKPPWAGQDGKDEVEAEG